VDGQRIPLFATAAGDAAAEWGVGYLARCHSTACPARRCRAAIVAAAPESKVAALSELSQNVAAESQVAHGDQAATPSIRFVD